MEGFEKVFGQRKTKKGFTKFNTLHHIEGKTIHDINIFFWRGGCSKSWQSVV